MQKFVTQIDIIFQVITRDLFILIELIMQILEFKPEGVCFDEMSG